MTLLELKEESSTLDSLRRLFRYGTYFGLLIPTIMSYIAQISPECALAMGSQPALVVKTLSLCYGIAGAILKERENSGLIKERLVRGQLLALLRSVEREFGKEYAARFRANVMVEYKDKRGRFLKIFAYIGDYSAGELEAKLYQEGGFPTGVCGVAYQKTEPVYVPFKEYGLDAENYSAVRRPDSTVPFNIPEPYWNLIRSLKAMYSISIVKDSHESLPCGVLNIDFMDLLPSELVDGEFTERVMQGRDFIAQVM